MLNLHLSLPRANKGTGVKLIGGELVGARPGASSEAAWGGAGRVSSEGQAVDGRFKEANFDVDSCAKQKTDEATKV